MSELAARQPAMHSAIRSAGHFYSREVRLSTASLAHQAYPAHRAGAFVAPGVGEAAKSLIVIRAAVAYGG
jgi:hypothetical protein